MIIAFTEDYIANSTHIHVYRGIILARRLVFFFLELYFSKFNEFDSLKFASTEYLLGKGVIRENGYCYMTCLKYDKTIKMA